MRIGHRDHDRQRGHAASPRPGGAQHRGRDRERVVRDLPVAHRETSAADLRQRTAQLRRVPDGERGERRERRGQHRLLHVGGRVREQDQPDAGRVQRPVRPDPGQDRYGLPPGDPLDVHPVQALAHGELDVLVGRLVKIFHERQRDVPQRVPAGAQRGQLDQAQPDPVPAVRAAFHRPTAPAHRSAGARWPWEARYGGPARRGCGRSSRGCIRPAAPAAWRAHCAGRFPYRRLSQAQIGRIMAGCGGRSGYVVAGWTGTVGT